MTSITCQRPVPDLAEWHRLHCSFCGKNSHRVRFLVSGKAGGFICDVCCLKSLLIFLRAQLAAIFSSREVRHAPAK